MSNNGTGEAPLPTATKPVGAEPILDSKGVVIYRPDQRTMAVPDEEATSLATTLQAQFPDDLRQNKHLAMVLAKAAIAYNLDPFLNEITVYRGKPFFPLEGRLRIAQNNATFRGVFARPATEEERKAWGCASRPEIILWRADAYRSDWVDPKTGEMRPVTGWGEVNVSSDQNPVAKQRPNQLAEVRATKRALRSLYNTPLPFRDLPDEAEFDRDDERAQAADWLSPDGRVLDQRPGGNLLTPGQNAAIHAICKELGIDEVRRHELLHAMFGKNNAGELNEADAAAFLEWLGIQATKNAPQLIEDPRASAYPVLHRAASKRFHTAAAAASFVPPRIVEPEPERPDPGMAEGMILEGPNGQRFVVDGGRLVPFVEAPRETEEPSQEDADQVHEDPAQDAVAENAELDPEEGRIEEEQSEPSEPGAGHIAANLPEEIPTGLADRILALAESARLAEPQPWWQNTETVAHNKAGVRRFLKGTGVRLTDAAIATLYRLLTIALSGYDPGAGDAEQDLSPAYCAVLQGQAKADLAAMKDDLEMLVLEGILG